MTTFRDQTILVTGAASGLGRLMSRTMAAEGGRLVLWDVDAAGLQSARAELGASGASIATYVCDLSERAAIAQVAARTLADCGPIDILVNNAGVVSGKALLDASDRDIERTFAVNALALFWTTRAFLPAMLERNRGHIVTIASAAGLVGTVKLVDYCASKHAAVGFDESLRLELKRARSRVRTTVVCPFYISTGMFEGVRTRVPFLLPILTPEYAVARICDAIRKDSPRLIMPRFVALTYLARVWPVAWFDGLMDFLGVTRSMDEFRGREVPTVDRHAASSR